MNSKIRGSGILIVILSAITFTIYASSAFVQREHFDIIQNKYENTIKTYYESDIENIDDLYDELCIINGV